MMDWQPISTAPFDRLIEVSVADGGDLHVFAFPVRRLAGGWLADGVKGRIDINPTHWRECADNDRSARRL